MDGKPWTYKIGPRSLALHWLEKVLVIDYATAKRGTWHTHPELELIFKIAGVSAYNLHGRPNITLASGQVLVVPPGFNHRLGGEIDSPGKRLCLMIRADPCLSGDIIGPKAFDQFRDALLAKALVPFPCPKPLFARLRQTMDVILARRGRLSAMELARLRLAMTDAFCNVTEETTISKPSEMRILDEALGYLDRHLADNVSMRSLVTYMGYGQTRLFQLFKEKTGVTPAEWRIRRRIERAKKLLSSTDATVVSVSRQTGFSDSCYFCRVFKRYTGYTPNGFRRAGI